MLGSTADSTEGVDCDDSAEFNRAEFNSAAFESAEFTTGKAASAAGAASVADDSCRPGALAVGRALVLDTVPCGGGLGGRIF